jgi:hypothetical protein
MRSGPGKLELRGFSDSREDRMDVHKNARPIPRGRERVEAAIRLASSGVMVTVDARLHGDLLVPHVLHAECPSPRARSGLAVPDGMVRRVYRRR